jgi:hypothetical protein
MEWQDKLLHGNWTKASWTKHNNYLKFTFEGLEPVLVVGFDHDRDTKVGSSWEPWASSFAFQRNYHYIGFSAHISDWYLDEWIEEQLSIIGKNSSSYKKILFTGASMGGYAALRYSRSISNAYVAAFAPQTTLENSKQSFDARYETASRLDWSGAETDAANTSGYPDHSYVFYDPKVTQDLGHAERLLSSKVKCLPVRDGGHSCALYLNKMGVLQLVVDRILNNDLTKVDFFQLLRNRRVMMWYHKKMVDRLEARPDSTMLDRFTAAFERNKSAVAENLNIPMAKHIL